MEPETKERPIEQEKLEKSRHPYTKPDIIYRAPLEAMAGVCLGAIGKVLGQQGCSVIQS
ncbi:MAG: hypothetical protein ACM3JD_19040 [Rudaea sp.]